MNNTQELIWGVFTPLIIKDLLLPLNSASVNENKFE